MYLVFLAFYVSDMSCLWKTYRMKQIFLLMKYSIFHSRGRKTDMHMRMSYVPGGSLAISVLISADRNLHCLASLLVQQKFLGERKKRKAARPCYYALNYTSEPCKIVTLKSKLIQQQVSFLRRYQRFGKSSAVMPSYCSHFRGRWPQLFASCSLWGLILPFTLTGSPQQEQTSNYLVSLELLPQLQHCPMDRLLYLQAAPWGSLCPRTTQGLAWEMPSSLRSSR